MCNMAEGYIEYGREEGIELGKVEGLANGKKLIAKEMLKDGTDIKLISKWTGLTRHEIQELASDLKLSYAAS